MTYCLGAHAAPIAGSVLHVPPVTAGLTAAWVPGHRQTLESGKVSNFKGMFGTAIDLSQADTALQPVPRPYNPAAGGRTTLIGDGTDKLQNTTAGVLNFAHSGPSTIFAVADFTGVAGFVLSTLPGQIGDIPNEYGVRFLALNPDQLEFSLANGSGTLMVDLISAVDSLPSGFHIVAARQGTGESPEVELFIDNVSVANASLTGSYDATDHSGALTFMDRSANFVPLVGDMGICLIYNRYLSTAELTSLSVMANTYYEIGVL